MNWKLDYGRLGFKVDREEKIWDTRNIKEYKGIGRKVYLARLDDE